MISWSGRLNIPVEDKSYKWSKKILKAAPETGLLATNTAVLIKYQH